ncbi:MAG: hypothetical protein IKO89_04830 [Bacteroidales bacterium]|nr:hypothetical protein [Bacteroidales bacterium]MBR4487871.1 hypothetical protein [Bacteroidales bacterium]
MKKIVIYVVSVTLFLLSGCEKGFDYRNKWEGNYEVKMKTVSGDVVVQNDEVPTGYLTVKKNADDEMRFEFRFKRDGNDLDQSYSFHVDKKGNISSDLKYLSGVDGYFIKRDSLVLTLEEHGHNASNQHTYYCKKTKKDFHDVVKGQ